MIRGCSNRSSPKGQFPCIAAPLRPFSQTLDPPRLLCERSLLARLLRTVLGGGASAAVRDHVRLAKRASNEVALVWAEAGAGDCIEEAVDRIEQAGAIVSEVIVFDVTSTAEVSLELRMRRTTRPTMVVRSDRETFVAKLFEAATDLLTAPLLVVGSRHASLSPISLRSGLEQIWMDNIDAWLPDHPPDEEAGCGLPRSLQGAIIRRRTLSSSGGAPELVARWPDGLAPMSRFAKALRTGCPFPKSLNERGVEAFGLPRAPPLTTATTDFVLGKFLRPQRPGHDTLLIVVHGNGGGTIRYAVNVAAVAAQRFDVLFAWGINNREIVLSSVSPDVPEVALLLPSGLDVAVAAMKKRKVVRADVIHFKGLDKYIDTLLECLRVPFDLTLVDFYSVALSPHLRDKQGRYIGDQVLSDLAHPMRRTPTPLLRRAERRIAISRDTATRFQKMVPDLSFIAARIPEPLDPRDVAVHLPPIDPDTALRVLVLGAFTPHKGSQTILEVARKASEAAVPVAFHVLGGVPKPPDAISQRNVYLYGSYPDKKLTELIHTIQPHLAWMPFSVPETHSFTLSDVMLHGLPILTVGLGAIAERLEGREKTWVLEPTSASPDAYLDWLVRLRRERLEIPATCPSTLHLPPLSEGFYETDYLAQRHNTPSVARVP